MPLATEPKIIPETPQNALTPVTPRPGQRPDGEFKNSVVDIRKRSVDTLLAHVEGSRWNITYYRQLLTVDMEPVSFQELQNIPFQQYEKISDYPLSVTSPLSTAQNAETSLFTVTGSAILSVAIVPNVGDVFIADIGDGRYGVFSVESHTRKTILKDSVFEIDYTLVEYSHDELIELLDRKVVRKLFYSEDHLGSGRGPLITEFELHQYRKIEEEINSLFGYHTNKFLDKNNTTLLRPEDTGIYDPYFSIFWDKILPKETVDLMNIPRIIAVGDEYRNYITIWDCILNKNFYSNSISIGTKTVNSFSRNLNLIYNGISLTDIRTIITMDDSFLKPEPLEYDTKAIKMYFTNDYHPVNSEGFYVLSEYYYTKKLDEISRLEYLVMNYINGMSLNLDHYSILLNNVKRQNDLMQFYYIPILICLGIDYLRSVS